MGNIRHLLPEGVASTPSGLIGSLKIDRRTMMKASAGFAAMAATAGLPRPVAKAQGSETIAGEWVQPENIGGSADFLSFEADFPFYAIAPHWPGETDFDAAVAGTVRSVFSNCGQVCLCSERVYVERPIFEKFVAALAKGAEALKHGNPFDEQTGIGPLISKQHQNKVLSYFELARQEGAEVVTGGGIPSLSDTYQGGSWIQPTIWTGLSEQARCMREEVFGPVCHITPFDTEEEAIMLANDSEYGLAAAVWTTNLSRAHRVSAAMETGIVWVNTWFLRDLRTPFGGSKASGIGREGGQYSMDFYSETKNICIKL